MARFPSVEHFHRVADSVGWLLSLIERDSAPIFWRDIAQRLGKRPAVAARVEDGALALTVRKVARLLNDCAAVFADTVA